MSVGVAFLNNGEVFVSLFLLRFTDVFNSAGNRDQSNNKPHLHDARNSYLLFHNKQYIQNKHKIWNYIKLYHGMHLITLLCGCT